MQKKVYVKRSEKVIDFLIGFFGLPFVITAASSMIGWWASNLIKIRDFNYYAAGIFLVVWLLGIGFAIYLGIKRRYIGIGFLFAVVIVPLVLAGTCLLIFGVSSLFGTIFRT